MVVVGVVVVEVDVAFLDKVVIIDVAAVVDVVVEGGVVVWFNFEVVAVIVGVVVVDAVDVVVDVVIVAVVEVVIGVVTVAVVEVVIGVDVVFADVKIDWLIGTTDWLNDWWFLW